MPQDNPFADLIPKKDQANPFADLIPEKKTTRPPAVQGTLNTGGKFKDEYAPVIPGKTPGVANPAAPKPTSKPKEEAQDPWAMNALNKVVQQQKAAPKKAFSWVTDPAKEEPKKPVKKAPAKNTPTQYPANGPQFGQPNVVQQFQKKIDVSKPGNVKRLKQEQGKKQITRINTKTGQTSIGPETEAERRKHEQAVLEAQTNLRYGTVEQMNPRNTSDLSANDKAIAPGQPTFNSPGAAVVGRQEWIKKYGYDPEKEPARAAQDTITGIGHEIAKFIEPIVGPVSPERLRGQSDTYSFLAPQELAGKKKVSEFAANLGEAATFPIDVAIESAVLLHPNSSIQDRLGAIANTILKVGLPEFASGEGSVLRSLGENLKKLKLGNAGEKQAAKEIESAFTKAIDNLSLEPNQKAAILDQIKANPDLTFKGFQEGKPVVGVKADVKGIPNASTLGQDGKLLYHGSLRSADELAAEGGPVLTSLTEYKPTAERYAHTGGGLRQPSDFLIVDAQARQGNRYPVFKRNGEKWDHIGWTDENLARVSKEKASLPSIPQSEITSSVDAYGASDRFHTMYENAQLHTVRPPKSTLNLDTQEGAKLLHDIAPSLVNYDSYTGKYSFDWSRTKWANARGFHQAKDWASAIEALKSKGYDSISYTDYPVGDAGEAARKTIAVFGKPDIISSENLVKENINASLETQAKGTTQSVLGQERPQVELPQTSTGTGINGIEAQAQKEKVGAPNEETQIGNRPTVQGTEGQASQVTLGLANQTLERMAKEGRIKIPESVGGRKFGVAQAEGRAAVESGEINPFSLARDLDVNPRPINYKEAGALLEGARRLENHANALNDELEAIKAQYGSAAKQQKKYNEKFAEWEDAQAQLNEYLRQAQRGKTELSDAFRALQEGTTLDEGNLAQVIARREKKLGVDKLDSKEAEKLKAQVEELRTQIKRAVPDWNPEKETLDQALQRITKPNEKVKAEAVANAFGRSRPRNVEQARRVRTEAASRISKRLAEIGAKTGSGTNFFYDLVQAAPEIAQDIKIIIRSLIEEHKIKKLGPELYNVVRKELPNIEITDEDINHVLAGIYDDVTSLKQSDYAKIRAQARKGVGEATAEELKVGKERLKALRKKEVSLDTLADLEDQLSTGGFWENVPKVKQATKAQEKLDLQIAIKRKQIRKMVEERDMSKAAKIFQNTAGLIRNTKLGSDAGLILRQGLFSIGRGRAFAHGLQNFVKALGSDEAWEAIDRSYLLKEYSDGRLAEPIRKAAGLSTTDVFLNPEELRVIQALKKIPGLGNFVGGLERGQSAFINTVRRDAFDWYVEHAKNVLPDELEARARFINSATGRSNIKSVPQSLNFLMTSPRYTTSRWEMIGEIVKNPVLAFKSEAARENLKDLGATAGLVLGSLKLAEAAGYQVNYDPFSNDFLKIRRGDQTYDPTAGMGKVLRTAIRLLGYGVYGLSKKATDMSGGQIPTIGKEMTGQENIAKELGKIFTDTVSPVITSPILATTGKSITGFDLDEGERGLMQFAPLIASGFLQTLSKEGPKQAIIDSLPEFFGIGTSRYPSHRTDALGRPYTPQLVNRDQDVLQELERLKIELPLPSIDKEFGETNDQRNQRALKMGEDLLPMLREVFKDPDFRSLTPTEKKDTILQLAHQSHAATNAEWSAAKANKKAEAKQKQIEAEKKAGVR